MSFLLNSFFTVLVSSTMGLPLLWVSSPSASTAGASLSWAPVVLGLFHVEVVSVRLNPSHGTIDVTCVEYSSIATFTACVTCEINLYCVKPLETVSKHKSSLS